MNALSLIEHALLALGYAPEALHRAYSFADVLNPTSETRTVALAAFTQIPESFRSAAFGVIDGGGDGAAAVMANRALGAPIFFSIDTDDIGVWAVGARQAPRLLERVGVDQLAGLFERYHDRWTPQALHRAKSVGTARGPVQVDFVDFGLLPAIEQEVQLKLHHTMADVMALLLPGDDVDRDSEKAAFRLTFRLLAAKILIDRDHPAAADWVQGDVRAVLGGIQAYYGLGPLGADVATVSADRAAAAWARLGKSITLRNISSDSLAYVYENTLVTADTRKLFGTHSTPRPLAEYVLDQIDLSRHDLDTIRLVEPFAGAGLFLVAALRQLRDQLPPNWTAERRHAFLVERLAGSELDVFACEVATLSLILADYPNANGWHVRSADLFEKGALAALLKGATVILCNPPFEDFTAEERLQYPEAFAISPSKAMVALDAAIEAGPRALGFVLPRGVLQQTKYGKLRMRLAAAYGRVQLVSLPDRIFEKATYPCALVIATDHRTDDSAEKLVRLTSTWVADKDRARFLVDGTITSQRQAIHTVSQDMLWLGELEALWAYLEDRPRLGDYADIFRGLRWRIQRAGVSIEPGPMREKGVYKPADSLQPFQLSNPVWLSTDPKLNLWPAPLTRPWGKPKVLINNQRSSRGPWRLSAASDRSGLLASQQFTALWPTRDYDVDVLAAVLNGPLANAFVTEHTTDHHFTNIMLATIPLPHALDTVALRQAVDDYKALLDLTQTTLQQFDRVDQLNRLLLRIDALVLRGYDLPPRLERQLFAYFDGRRRPTFHDFPGWLPKDLKGYVPLYEWLTRDPDANRGNWVLDVFTPAPPEEIDALARFLD